MKCKEYMMYSVLCQSCDIRNDIKCCKKFDFNTPLEFVKVKRTDMGANFSWNECPTCGKSIGYHPIDNEFRCPKCEQRILWN